MFGKIWLLLCGFPAYRIWGQGAANSDSTTSLAIIRSRSLNGIPPPVPVKSAYPRVAVGIFLAYPLGFTYLLNLTAS